MTYPENSRFAAMFKFFVIFMSFGDQKAVSRDSELTDIPSFTLKFRSKLPFIIEQNRRRSRGYVEDFVFEGAANMA
jgi:hypothetical protein